MTSEEFEKAYAERSGLTLEQLRTFRTVRPCQCGSEMCEGWQSLSFENARLYDEGDPYP